MVIASNCIYVKDVHKQEGMNMYYTDGSEYRLGRMTDYTVEVIRYDDSGNVILWIEQVPWGIDDTVGDAIKLAIEKQELDKESS